jgi:hypothetical protein
MAPPCDTKKKNKLMLLKKKGEKMVGKDKLKKIKPLNISKLLKKKRKAESVTDTPTMGGEKKKKKHSAMAAITVEEDADVIIAAKTLESLKNAADQQRDTQRAAALLKTRENLATMVSKGKITQQEADLYLVKEQKERNADVAAGNDTDAAPNPILIGNKNLPTSQKDVWTACNPYAKQNIGVVEDVGQQSTSKKPVHLKVR